MLTRKQSEREGRTDRIPSGASCQAAACRGFGPCIADCRNSQARTPPTMSRKTGKATVPAATKPNAKPTVPANTHQSEKADSPCGRSVFTKLSLIQNLALPQTVNILDGPYRFRIFRSSNGTISYIFVESNFIFPTTPRIIEGERPNQKGLCTRVMALFGRIPHMAGSGI